MFQSAHPAWHRPFLRYLEGDQGGGSEGDNEPDGDDDEESEKDELAKAVAEAAKWKKLSRQNEAKAKENAGKAQKFDELEAQSLSDLEKANARADAAEQWKADREARDAAAEMAKEVATEKGVPVSALRGSTRDELEAHADELLALIPKKPAAPSADGQGEGDGIGDGDMSADDIVAAATSR